MQTNPTNQSDRIISDIVTGVAKGAKCAFMLVLAVGYGFHILALVLFRLWRSRNN